MTNVACTMLNLCLKALNLVGKMIRSSSNEVVVRISRQISNFWFKSRNFNESQKLNISWKNSPKQANSGQNNQNKCPKNPNSSRIHVYSSIETLFSGMVQYSNTIKYRDIIVNTIQIFHRLYRKTSSFSSVFMRV